jgi:hypothetical protein
MSEVLIVKDPLGRRIILDDQGWAHITRRHAEVTPFRDELRHVLSSPEIILEDDAHAFSYSILGIVSGPYRQCYLRAVVEQRGDTLLVTTAHFDAWPGKGTAIWIRKRS